ncbi:MAG: 50S ribosomal protein L1 [Bacteriovoracia bacterium]
MANAEKKKGSIPGRGKKYSNAAALLEVGKRYGVEQAFGLLEKVAYAKFDETVEVCFKLGVDPKHAEQMIRGAVVLPHGVGKSARVAVIAKGDKAKEAEKAGADVVGGDDLIEKILGGWLEFDKLIATPDQMVAVSKVGKILGPKGLMPNPKLGTVTMDVTRAVEDQKKGKVEYRTDKTGLIHVAIGKKSFGASKLRDNFGALAQVIVRAKPPTSKGVYLQRITLSTTMSPGVQVDTTDGAFTVA